MDDYVVPLPAKSLAELVARIKGLSQDYRDMDSSDCSDALRDIAIEIRSYEAATPPPPRSHSKTSSADQ